MAINKKYIVGIDIGGSKINAVIFYDGKVFKKAKIQTPQKNRDYFLEALEALVIKLIRDLGDKKISGIGCGVAGVLDLKSGIILNAPNLQFLNNFNIKNWLSKKFNCDVKIDNDARCFTRGEFLFGAGKGYKNIVGITLGTGIGGGIIINGKMFYGASSAAGELGHMMMSFDKDWEFFAIKQTKNLEKYLGIGLANIVNILDPEIIIFGGGAAHMLKSLLAEAKKIMNKFIISPKSKKNVKILFGKLGENAGAIGAAALFYE
ncbi:MAG: ROK family protein [Patescibacteria group bacterium]